MNGNNTLRQMKPVFVFALIGVVFMFTAPYALQLFTIINLTTAIALETSKGELVIALALGVVLLALALIVNGLVTAVRTRASRYGYT